MCNDEDVKRRLRRLEVAAVVGFATAGVSILILFAHLIHDAVAFGELERIVKEYHQK